jgi:prevent-host-death family protein
MAEPHTLSATEFKATCLEVMDRVARGEWERVAITKRGKVVAVLVPPSAAEAGAAPLHGFLRGSVHGADAVDLTAPVLDEGFGAADGLLHG